MERAIGFTEQEKSKENKEIRKAESRLKVMLESKNELEERLELQTIKEKQAADEVYKDLFKAIQRAIENECEIIAG